MRPPLSEQSNSVLDSLTHNPDFQKTSLFDTFKRRPLGFVDIGSSGGVHPLVSPAASLVNALCFECNQRDCESLKKQYETSLPFHKVTVCQTALANETSSGKPFYVSRVPTNSSLLEPSADFARRYQAEKFLVDRVLAIPTQTLDSVIYGGDIQDDLMGEFIKLDTQGSEYEILAGARRVLEERCLGVWCEVSFFEVYRGQKTYADVDCLFREHGLLVYGFYPHYRSTKSLNRTRCATEERLMWADALFLKDPLDPRNRSRTFSKREIQVLILIAFLTHFYDFALELVSQFYPAGEERDQTEALIRGLAEVDSEGFVDEVAGLYKSCREKPPESYLLVQRFIARHRSNTNTDYVVSSASAGDPGFYPGRNAPASASARCRPPWEEADASPKSAEIFSGRRRAKGTPGSARGAP